MGGRGLPIRDDLSPSALRRLARQEGDPAAARRMYGTANALEGMTRAEAARLAGMERQALRDAVVRYNAEGLKGLYNRRRPPRPGKLTAAELQELSRIILTGPDPELGLSAWTLPELCRVIETRFNKSLHPEPLARAATGGFLATRSAPAPPQFGPDRAKGPRLPSLLAAWPAPSQRASRRGPSSWSSAS
jgi:transposase